MKVKMKKSEGGEGSSMYKTKWERELRKGGKDGRNEGRKEGRLGKGKGGRKE